MISFADPFAVNHFVTVTLFNHISVADHFTMGCSPHSELNFCRVVGNCVVVVVVIEMNSVANR